MLLMGVAEASNESVPEVTWQKTLSAASFEKLRMGERASIQRGISPSMWLSMTAPSADSASSTERKRGLGPRCAFS